MHIFKVSSHCEKHCHFQRTQRCVNLWTCVISKVDVHDFLQPVVDLWKRQDFFLFPWIQHTCNIRKDRTQCSGNPSFLCLIWNSPRRSSGRLTWVGERDREPQLEFAVYEPGFWKLLEFPRKVQKSQILFCQRCILRLNLQFAKNHVWNKLWQIWSSSKDDIHKNFHCLVQNLQQYFLESYGSWPLAI